MELLGINVFSFLCDWWVVSDLQFQDHVVIRFSRERGARIKPPIRNSNFEDCFTLGRNYALAATETTRRSELPHLASKRIFGGRQECQEEPGCAT
jgi:hypothetical protein